MPKKLHLVEDSASARTELAPARPGRIHAGGDRWGRDKGIAEPSGAKKAVALVAEFRETVLGITRRVNSLTERAALKTGECLRAIVLDAREHIGKTNSLRALVVDSGDSSVTRAIERQNAAVSGFLGQLLSGIARQGAQASEALEQSEKIISAATKISRLSSASHMLALNAEIEARRLGQQGAAFAVIAKEMKQLSREVELANRFVSDVAGELKVLAPEVCLQSKQLDVLARDFSSSHRAILADIERGTEALRTSVAAIVSSGHRAIENILQQSGEALSELQVQDPAAQALLGIDQRACELEQRIVDAGGLEGIEIAPPAISNLGGTQNLDLGGSGEVLWF